MQRTFDFDRLFDEHIESLRIASQRDNFDLSYYEKHRARFLQTCSLIPFASENQRALEIGSTEFFQVLLTTQFGFEEVVGTTFTPNVEEKIFKRRFSVGPHQTENLSISLDIERDLFPFGEGYFDFILYCEVIEHLERDPMFAFVEFNRLLKAGGRLLITTPNCCSARNFWKIAHGFRPHFFMQYHRSGELYRHNIEYDVPTLVRMAAGAGFAVVEVYTHDVFEPTLPEALDLLERSNLFRENRGDDIFLLVEKVGPVTERWPPDMYV